MLNLRQRSDIIEVLHQHQYPDSTLRYALICLVIAVIAAVLGATGVASFALNAAYVLGIIALILLVIHFVSGKSTTI